MGRERLRARGRRLAIVVSTLVHAGLLIVAFTHEPGAAEETTSPVAVELVAMDTVVVPSANEAPAPPAPPVRAVRAPAPRTADPPRATTKMPAPFPPAPEASAPPGEAPDQPGAAPATAAAVTTGGEGPRVALGDGAGLGTRPAAGTSAVTPGLTEARRRALIDRFLKDVLRAQIGARFHYPSEAERLELEGQVLVRVAIDARGKLLDARITGACPHALLCDDAVRTVRDASPFPPPPAELGRAGVISAEVPLQYRLE